MIPFLDKIADRLLQKFPDNMENLAIVFPSKRAVVFFKHYLSKKIDKPIFLPDFYSIEDFIENLSGLEVLDNISLQFRLYRTYLKYPPKKQDTFDDFLKWGNILIHDFNEIDRALVDAESIYTNLSRVKELESWNLDNWSFSDGNLTTIQSDYLSFFEGILKWYNDFNSSLLKENLAYQGLAYKKAVQNIEGLEIKWDKVWFVGLNALTKAEQAIVDFLKKENIARVFWDADKFYYENPLHEAGGFLRLQRDKWSEIDFKGVGDYYKEKKKSFNVIACPKNISQAKAAAQVLKSLPQSDLEDSRTAIVLADEALLYPVLHNLPSEVKHLNVTMGSPLSSTSLFAFVESLFNMQVHAQKYKREAFYYKDVIALIEHSYFSKIAKDKEIEVFKRFILKHNIVFISQSNIRNIFTNDFVIDLLAIWKNSHQAVNMLNQLVGCLRQSLVKSSATVESEVLSTFFKNIIVLQNLLAQNDFSLELKTLQVIIKQLVGKEIIPFQGEPLKGVQLMGILESRTLDFKNVIMLSVNEGKLPQGKSINSFIPYDMKKYFKLPTYSESDAVFSYHFYRLLQRANNISLIYNSQNDDFGSGEKSRFITQLLAEYTGEIKEYVYKSSDLEIKSSCQTVIKNQGLEDKIMSWAAKGVSPSALNKYNNCSLQFYYHYLANINSDEEVDEYVDAGIMGTAIHDALEANYPIGFITEQYIVNKTDAILIDIENNFLEMLSEQTIKEGKNYLSLRISQQLTKNFLRLEKKLISEANKNNKKIKILEKESDLSSVLLVDGVNFKLSGKVDRVDLEGDTLRIIDYKTGKVDHNEVVFTDLNELIENPKKAKAFQLLMYSYLYLKMHPAYVGLDVVSGNFSFKNLKAGLLKVSKRINSRTSEVVKIDQAILDDFESQLQLILTRINNNDFRQTDEVKNCQWCDYKSICRR